MLRIIFILHVVILNAISQCNEIYKVEGDQLFFGKQKIDALPGKFMIHSNPQFLTRWDNPNQLKYSDKTWVIYYCGNPMVDPFGDDNLNLQRDSKMKRYNPVLEKFDVVGSNHARDQHAIYFRGSVEIVPPHGSGKYAARFLKMDNVDLTTFELINHSEVYSRDKDHVFYCNIILPGADPKSFEILEGDELKKKLAPRFNFAQDKNHVYREFYVLKDIRPKDFKLLDQTHCLWKGKKYEILNSAQTKLIPVDD